MRCPYTRSYHNGRTSLAIVTAGTVQKEYVERIPHGFLPIGLIQALRDGRYASMQCFFQSYLMPLLREDDKLFCRGGFETRPYVLFGQPLQLFICRRCTRLL
jgi:hypothetical protein